MLTFSPPWYFYLFLAQVADGSDHCWRRRAALWRPAAKPRTMAKARVDRASRKTSAGSRLGAEVLAPRDGGPTGFDVRDPQRFDHVGEQPGRAPWGFVEGRVNGILRPTSLAVALNDSRMHASRSTTPIELLLAADEQSIARLHAAGRSEDGGVIYASGRLALFVPQQSLGMWQPDAAMQGLRQALQRQQIQRFAIANPELAPYGRAAREALQAVGLWQSIQSRLVLGENIAQAGQFASGGSTQGGILALSLALTPALQQRGRHVVLPVSLHQPIHQRMALMRGAGEAARALYRYLQQPAAQAILLAHGYAAPGADAAKATP